MIGIIIPPGQIKKRVQKTAQHVAANGPEFERMICQRQQNTSDFAFLQKDNPYRAYYDHMVANFSRKLLQQAQAINAPQIVQTKIQELKPLPQQEAKIQQPRNEQAQFLERVFQEIKQPDPDRFTAVQPQKITQAEIAIIQHTAQYVAKIGKDFLIALSQRQKSNPQFEFLKKSSANHEYFVKMYQAYQNLLNLSEQELSKIEQIKNNKDAIFTKCQQVFEYHSAKQKELKGKSDQANDESKKQSNIDWNDYEIVETIVFDSMKSKNKNLTLTNGQQKIMIQTANSSKVLEQKIISAPKKKEILQQCHICRNNILASQMTKHLKTCLGQKKRPGPVDTNFNKDNDEVDIRKNLQNLSTKRPDIFGGDGAKISRKENEQQNNNNDKIIWDGQAPNMSRATASIAMVNNQQRKINEQTK